jgi:hypothetical protein
VCSSCSPYRMELEGIGSKERICKRCITQLQENKMPEPIKWNSYYDIFSESKTGKKGEKNSVVEYNEASKKNFYGNNKSKTLH